MSTVEKETHNGLTEKQKAEAKKLYEDYKNAEYTRYYNRNELSRHPIGWVAAPLTGVVRLARTESRAEKHYQKNRSAYHEQAVKDATDEGVEVNFNGDVAKSIERSKEE